MKRLLLILSAGLNVALAAAAFHYVRRPEQRQPPAPAFTNTRPVRTPDPEGTNLSQTANFVTNRFHWRQLESADYEQYMANLRAAGCPGRTVRDIIVADVRKLYALKS